MVFSLNIMVHEYVVNEYVINTNSLTRNITNVVFHLTTEVLQLLLQSFNKYCIVVTNVVFHVTKVVSDQQPVINLFAAR